MQKVSIKQNLRNFQWSIPTTFTCAQIYGYPKIWSFYSCWLAEQAALMATLMRLSIIWPFHNNGVPYFGSHWWLYKGSFTVLQYSSVSCNNQNSFIMCQRRSFLTELWLISCFSTFYCMDHCFTFKC